MKESMIRKIPAGVIYENGFLRAASDEAEFSPAEGQKKTMAYQIMAAHNLSENPDKLQIRFDAMASHDITYVGIIQTARASGLTEFPMPYVLTNCHNSLCAVGGTINEDDHVFGLSCAKKYGGIYVPPHLAVIHQYAREMLSGGGRMILGSDSHTRYGALGTMAIGEGGPELVKQLLLQTYDIDRPEVVAVYLTGELQPGVGPQDVAIALVGAVFADGFVKNKVLEFVGPGISGLSVDMRIGIDVMTTETTCLSSIWETDEKVREFYEIHRRPEAYKELHPSEGAYYDCALVIDLSEIEPMIALPFHPSNAYTIRELYENLDDILHDTEEKAKISFGPEIGFTLRDKVHNGKLCVEQGVIAGCAGGGFENLTDAADILRGGDIGNGEFSLSIYPASQPVYLELLRNGSITDLAEAGATIRTAFCGPCFGAGDVPANKGLSIRHSTRNFPNREGSKPANGQIASVALMDARSIAATALNQGVLTPATELSTSFTKPKYFFDGSIYEKRVYNGYKKALPETEIKRGPNIVDWPKMEALKENLLLQVVSEIHDPVTTTDELIPSGETSSYRSNPLGLAEFTLSRKDPQYVGRAKAVQAPETQEKMLEAAKEALEKCGISAGIGRETTTVGSTIYATKPGDGSAREQAASCQRVLGGAANIAREYATKRYRSNLINWGMIPFTVEGELPFKNLDCIYVPEILSKITGGELEAEAYVIPSDGEAPRSFTLRWAALTPEEREIIAKGCLINYNNIIL